MEFFYNSYTRIIQHETYYFVKKFQRFPEYDRVPDLLIGYGMHRDFNKACNIATIEDMRIRQQLLAGMEGPLQQAKLIEMKQVTTPARRGILSFFNLFPFKRAEKKMRLSESIHIKSQPLFRRVQHP